MNALAREAAEPPRHRRLERHRRAHSMADRRGEPACRRMAGG